MEHKIDNYVYYVNGIPIPTIQDYVKIRKMDSDFTADDLYRIFFHPTAQHTKESLTKIFDETPAFTPAEFIARFPSIVKNHPDLMDDLMK